MSEFTVNATARQDVGKGASRRLRKQSDQVPAIVYGGKKDPQMISVPHKDMIYHLDQEAFYTSVLNLSIDGNVEQVVLKDLQRHPAKPKILHADFLRVDASTPIHIKVPLHFINEDKCRGVKEQGGQISHSMTEVDVSCLPKDLPEFIEVDMSDIEVGHSVHLSDLKLPSGVQSVQLSHGADHDLPVSSVLPPRGGVQEEGGEAEGGEGSSEA